jgi:hypothetical protein
MVLFSMYMHIKNINPQIFYEKTYNVEHNNP